MTFATNPYLAVQGTLWVSPGGGGALTPLTPGAANQVIVRDATQLLGIKWGAGGMGNMTGPVSSTAHNLSSFADTSGSLLEDSGIAKAAVAIGPMTSTAHTLAAFASTDGVTLEATTVLTANVVQGPASATDDAVARFNLTTGKLIDNSGVLLSDANNMTFPAGSGVKLTAGATASETKGSFTLSSGTHAKILTTAAVTGCCINFTTVTLGTVTVASAFLATIDTGVGFTPVASQATDTSVVNWCIVG